MQPDLSGLSPNNMSWDTRNNFRPRDVALYFAHHGVLLSADSANALSKLLLTIEKGEPDE